MEGKTIGLIAAMPGETKPLLKKIGQYAKSELGGFPLYRFCVGGKQCLLIESGIGIKRATEAVQVLLASCKPDLLISFGLGGAVKPGLMVGDLVIAGRAFLYDQASAGGWDAVILPDQSSKRRILETICQKLGCGCLQGEFLTSDKILDKKMVAGILPPDVTNPVLDMETWAVAHFAGRSTVPLLAVRSISDACDEELDFSMDQFTDNEMNIRIWKIILTIARKPWILPQLIRLAGNSRVAGRNLAAALKGLLETVILHPDN